MSGEKSKISFFAGCLIFALLEPANIKAAGAEAGKFAGIYLQIETRVFWPIVGRFGLFLFFRLFLLFFSTGLKVAYINMAGVENNKRE